MDFSQTKGHRKTEFGSLPEQDDIDAKTTPSHAKSKSTANLEKTLDDFFESCTKK